MVRALVYRIEMHFAEEDVEGQDMEATHVREVLRANDYPDRFVEHVSRRRVAGLKLLSLTPTGRPLL